MIGDWCIEIAENFVSNKIQLAENYKLANKISIEVLQKKLENIILPTFFPDEYQICTNFLIFLKKLF